MPQYFMVQNGVDPIRDVTTAYVGSQESSNMNAYLGKSAAGGTWPPPWRAFQRDHPAEAAELMVAWTTPPASVSLGVTYGALGSDAPPDSLAFVAKPYKVESLGRAVRDAIDAAPSPIVRAAAAGLSAVAGA